MKIKHEPYLKELRELKERMLKADHKFKAKKIKELEDSLAALKEEA